jgi:hypothetical protein
VRREFHGRRSRRGPARAALFAFVSGTALAQEPPPPSADTPVSVVYEVAPVCPKVDYFQQRVRDRAPRTLFVEQGAGRAFRVSARAEAESWVGELAALPAVDESSVRRVTGASCGDVIAALSLIAAVAIDPAAAGQAPAPVTTAPLDAQNAPPADTTATSAPAPPPPVPVRPVAPTAQAPESAPQSGVGSRVVTTPWDVSFGANGIAAFGKAPGALFGIGASVGAGPVAPPGRLLSWFVVFSATALFPRELGDPLKAEFEGQFFTLEGCFLRFSLGKVIFLRPCLGLEGGRLLVDGIQQASLATIESQSAAYGAAVQTLRTTVALGRVFALEAIGTLEEPFSHDSFGYQRPAVPIYTIPAVSGSVALGIRLSLW